MATMKFAVTPGFGVGGTVFNPEQLSTLGAVVGDNARIELTTFKQLYVEVEETHYKEIMQRLSAVGLEIHPAGFYTKSLITCNFCRGEAEAGLKTAKLLDAVISAKAVPSPLKIGYAGCALGTSEPLLKDIGVVKMLDKFDIYIGGESKGLKASTAQLFLSGLSEEDMISVVQRLVKNFQEHGKKKEKYSKFIERYSIDALRKLIA